MSATIHIRATPLQIPLRSNFKHASQERRLSDSVWVEAMRGECTGLGEGCPRSYVTGENTAGALAWIEALLPQILAEISDLQGLKAWVKHNERIIDTHPAAWCAVETALLDLFAKEKAESLEALLGLPELRGPFQYTAVLSDDAPEKFKKTLQAYFEMGFKDFKFKISADAKKDQEKFELFAQMVERKSMQNTARLRLDANNVWAGNGLGAGAYLSALEIPVFAIEEPLAARDIGGLSALSVEHNIGIVLDESLCNAGDLKGFRDQPGRWIANLRISKMGGILRSLDLISEFQNQNMGIIVGAQVGETSILSRVALCAAQASGSSLLAQEGAFGTLLLEYDPVHPLIVFGAGGALTYPPAGSEGPLPGLGLQKCDSAKKSGQGVQIQL